MTILQTLLSETPYSVPAERRTELLLQGLNELTAHHYTHSLQYERIVRGAWAGHVTADRIEDVPYLPVSLFKTTELRSVPQEEVRMTMTSSGTTGQAVSRIAVDAQTSTLQQRALANSLAHVLGSKRLPMLVIDTADVFKNPRLMSARGAGVLGMMRFGHDHAFALDQQLAPDIAAVRNFLDRHGKKPFFMFGFTFIVWLQFYEQFKGLGIDLSNGILIHSGGWKKMVERAIGNEQFRAAFKQEFGLYRIHNFYGMVEQLGSIFLEGENGLLYPPNFSDVLIRCPETWQVLPLGEQGVIQVVSLLPRSYPGHSLLTEDLGVIEAVDPEPGRWMGHGIRVLGRMKRAELRGCSDVVATSMAA